MGFTVTHDAEWLPEDHLAAIEWQGEQDLLCPGCKRPRDETMREEGDPLLPHYEAEAVVCHACEVLSRESHHIAKEHGDEPLHGWLWGITQSTNGS